MTSGETLLLFGGGGSVGIIATQLALAPGVKVIGAVSSTTKRSTANWEPRRGVRRGRGQPGPRAGHRDPMFDAAGKGIMADAITLAGGPKRVMALPHPTTADYGVTLSQPTPDRAPSALDKTIALLADRRLRLRAHSTMPMQQAAEAHRQLESGTVHQPIILALN